MLVAVPPTALAPPPPPAVHLVALESTLAPPLFPWLGVVEGVFPVPPVPAACGASAAAAPPPEPPLPTPTLAAVLA